MNDLSAAIRVVAEALPAGSSVSVPRDWLLALLTAVPTQPPEAPAPANLITVKEAARILRVAPSWIYRARPPFVVRVGSRMLKVREDKLTAWIKRSGV